MNKDARKQHPKAVEEFVEKPREVELTFLDHLALRSITWNELPDPIKLILCTNAIEMECRNVWRLSIKLREVPVGEAGDSGIGAEQYVLCALEEIFGEYQHFAGALRSQPGPYDGGLFVDVIVNHDFGWSEHGLLVKDIVERHPLVVKCDSGMIVGEQQNKDRLVSGNYGLTASHMLNALSAPNQTRRRLDLQRKNLIKRDASKSGKVSQKDIVRRSIKAIGRKKHFDTYDYDGLLILPANVVKLGAALWDEFQPELVSLHHGKLFAA